MSTFSLFATVTASTKRSPAAAGGKRGVPVENIASLSCTPLDPLTPEIAHTIGASLPYEGLQTFTEAGLDILPGDLLVIGSTEYRVSAVGEWYWPIDKLDTNFYILEEILV